MTDIATLVTELAYHSAASGVDAGHRFLAAATVDDDQVGIVFNATLVTFRAAAQALRTPLGLVAMKAVLTEFAEHPDVAKELRLAAKTIIAVDQLDDPDTTLADIGHGTLEGLAAEVDADRCAGRVIAAVPYVYSLLLPELFTADGRALLARFAEEVSRPEQG